MPSITLSEETTFITEPKLPDGTPDYAAFLNARHGAGVTPDNNAAALIAPVLGTELDDETYELMGVDPERASSPPRLMGSVLWEDFDAYLKSRIDDGPALSSCDRRAIYEAFFEEDLRNGGGPCAARDCPATAAWIEANDEALSAIQAASRRAHYFIPRVEGTSLASQGIRSLLAQRQAAQALRARAMLFLGRGAWSEAASDVFTAYRLSDYTGRGSLIEKLVAISQRHDAATALAYVASSPGLEPKRTRELLSELLKVDDISFDYTTERIYALATVLHLWAAGDAENWKKILEPVDFDYDYVSDEVYRIPAHLVDWDEALRFLNRSWQRFEVDGSVPDVDWASRLEEPELTRLLDRVEHDADARAELARAVVADIDLLPPRKRAFLSLNESRARSRFAIATLAMALFRVEHGRWPTRLGELPGVLTEAPGYDFRLDVIEPNGVAIAASPKKYGQTGSAAFCWDGNGGMLNAYDGSKPTILDGRCHFPRPSKTVGMGSKRWRLLVLAGVGLASLLLLGSRPTEGSAAIVCVLFVGTVLLWAGASVVRFRNFASKRISDVHGEISRARSVAPRLPELSREFERRKETLSTVKELLPESLETEHLESTIVGWVEETGMTVEGRWLDKDFTPHYRAQLTVCLAEEDGERIERLYDRRDALPPSVRVIEAERTEAGVEIVLDWFALLREKSGTRPAEDLCEKLDDAPPLAVSRDVRLACDEWERLRPIVTQAAEYSADLRDLERRERMLEQIR